MILVLNKYKFQYLCVTESIFLLLEPNGSHDDQSHRLLLLLLSHLQMLLKDCPGLAGEAGQQVEWNSVCRRHENQSPTFGCRKLWQFRHIYSFTAHFEPFLDFFCQKSLKSVRGFSQISGVGMTIMERPSLLVFQRWQQSGPQLGSRFHTWAQDQLRFSSAACNGSLCRSIYKQQRWFTTRISNLCNFK